MDEKKYYFLAPGLDFTVDSITLGSIIVDPLEPHVTLFTPQLGDIDPNNIIESEKSDATETIIEISNIKAGLFAQFLEIMHIGLDANMKVGKVKTKFYSFKKLQTKWFAPSEPLLDKATQSDRVQEYLKMFQFEKPVYMVTGVKIAKGANVIIVNQHGRGFRAALGIDMTPSGVPITLGPKAEGEDQKMQHTTFKDSSPIAFAFRLKEIRFVPQITAREQITARDLTEGALFAANAKKENTRVRSLKDEFTEDMLEDLGLEAHKATDEGDDESECFTILPREFPS
ncbi:hypothetical protein IFM53868_10997 [Aspergillus udagawae]|uniref:Uncharacterized protein n=1 Tax=Aspergillus udagawae TaxID=91492 RepID=A0ABQ1BFH3_9EURO|nr:hypothetical protein IFM53868_10997 [Aspergillus udagawae]